MQINTRVFGEIEIDDNKIITFDNGLMGFEEYKRYAIIFDSEKESKGKIMWLQSMDDPRLAFPVIDPMFVNPEYNPIVEDEWLESIGEFNSGEDLYLLAVLTVPSDLTRMTANMKAPLIINTLTKKGCQMIVNNEDYLVRYNVYEYIQSIRKEAGEC